MLPRLRRDDQYGSHVRAAAWKLISFVLTEEVKEELGSLSSHV